MTAADQDGRFVGVTISSFASVSLNPPLVLYCIDRATVDIGVYLSAERFAVNMLAESHAPLSQLFAGHRPDKFAHAGWSRTASGQMVLREALCALECERERIDDGGDHHIILGRVERVWIGDDGRPLLYHRRGYRRLAEFG